MSGYIKYFANGGKSMSFVIKDDDVLDKYKIWDKIKNKLNIKFHRAPVYDKKYLKAKVTEFDGRIKTNFLDKKVPIDDNYYTCIACVAIGSVLKIEKKKKNDLHICLEECKYKKKMAKMIKSIEVELKSESDSEPKSDTELMTKLKSDSDSE